MAGKGPTGGGARSGAIIKGGNPGPVLRGAPIIKSGGPAGKLPVRAPLDPTRSPANPGIPVRGPVNKTPITPVRGAPIVKQPVRVPVKPPAGMGLKSPAAPRTLGQGGGKQRRDKIGRFV